jgi:hypothetical protein
VNLQDELVDVAMTFGWLRRPTEIEARWPRLMAGLRRVVDRVKADHTTRRRSLGLDVACGQPAHVPSLETTAGTFFARA